MRTRRHGRFHVSRSLRQLSLEANTSTGFRRQRWRITAREERVWFCRNSTCPAHVHSNTQTRTRASEWTQVRTKTHAHVTIVHYRTVGCEGAVIRGSQYHQGRCAGCQDHRGWKPEQPPDATHTTVGPRDRRRGGHSSGRVHQRRTIGAGAGSGKTEVGGSVERRLSGSSWMEAGAAAGCYPHYRRAADAAGTYPALSHRDSGYAGDYCCCCLR